MKVVGYLVLFIIWGSGFVTGWACKPGRGVKRIKPQNQYQRTFVVQYPEIRSIYSVQQVLDSSVHSPMNGTVEPSSR